MTERISGSFLGALGMVKKYREFKTTPQELKCWQDVGTLYYDVTERNRVATKRDIDSMKKLVTGGLPLPTVVLLESYLDGKLRYRIVYGAGFITAVLSYLNTASDKEKSTPAYQAFIRCKIKGAILLKTANKHDCLYLFDAFKGFNRKG